MRLHIHDIGNMYFECNCSKNSNNKKKKCVTHFLKFLEKVEHEKSNSYTLKIYYIPQTAIYDS